MNVRKIVAGLVLADFAALNGYALYTAGAGGLVEFASSLSGWSLVITADLFIALTMVLIWMWGDARKHGRNPIGYTLLTLGTGSVGTLLYLVAGKSDATEPSTSSGTESFSTA